MTDDSSSNEEKRHTLQVVGRIGVKEVYLNISKEEACKRYQESRNSGQVLPIDSVDTYHFNEQFQAVNIWESDRDPGE